MEPSDRVLKQGEPDFLVVGHITKDVTPSGFSIGGTVTYSALTARNLGRRVAVLTRAEPGLALDGVFAEIDLRCLPSRQTTTFENVYQDGVRIQHIRALADPIEVEAIPEDLRGCPIVHLGPLVQELPGEIVDAFPQSLLGVTPQGWMRQWDEEGLVSPVDWASAEKVLARADVLIFSKEDVAHHPELIERYAEMARIMVVTVSRRGAWLYHKGERKRFPAFAAQEVDPTGAGDVFAAAFLVRLHETGDPEEATHFANCVASFCVEKPGTLGIPTREQVEERLRRGQLLD